MKYLIGLVVGVLLVALLGVSEGRMRSYIDNPYGLSVQDSSGNPLHGARVIHKFGSNPGPAADEDVWDCPEITAAVPETYPFQSGTFTLYHSSDNENDAGLPIVVEGLDENWERQTEAAVLGADTLSGGTTITAFTSTWRRVFRAYNAGSSALAGNVYFNNDGTDAGGDGVPDTLTGLQACIRPGNEQTLMAIYTTAADESTWITQHCASIVDESPQGASAGFASLLGMARLADPTVMVFRVQTLFGLHSEGTNFQCRVYDPPLYILPKTDLKGRISNTTQVDEVSATFDLIVMRD